MLIFIENFYFRDIDSPRKIFKKNLLTKMDLPPSKLASTASRVWDESTSHFHKTDINIDLGLHGLSDNKNGNENSPNKPTSSSGISSGYVFGSRLFERAAQKV
ncbi:unnamed protein product [Meloidogyne enterolobii]|uniref:Uncharacterized protein n=1 Tax=Meloidogyne enterolobii TaxID=390850 RepID=A0ACB0Z6N6_MELEN